MKNTILLMSVMFLVGCNGSGGGSASGDSAPQGNVVVSPTASPTTTPAPSASPAPSATPTPTPTPNPGWGGFSGGGVLANPYQVTTATDVQHIADFPGAYFELTGNIDMSGISFTPITNFSGVIQGHLYKLMNLTIIVTGGQPAAFAITLSGIITQMYMSNILISSDTNFAAAYAFNVSGTVSNCDILSGSINSPQGGNGNNTGTGNPFVVNRVGGSVVTGDQSTVSFNGNFFFGTF